MTPEQFVLTIFTSALEMIQGLNTMTFFGVGIISVLVVLFILYYLVPLIFKLLGYDMGDDD